ILNHIHSNDIWPQSLFVSWLLVALIALGCMFGFRLGWFLAGRLTDTNLHSKGKFSFVGTGLAPIRAARSLRAFEFLLTLSLRILPSFAGWYKKLSRLDSKSVLLKTPLLPGGHILLREQSDLTPTFKSLQIITAESQWQVSRLSPIIVRNTVLVVLLCI